MRTRICEALALMVVAAGSVMAQTADSLARRPVGRLLGVFDAASGKPIAGVEIRDAFSGAYTRTTASGTVSLAFLYYRGSAALVELMKLGYEEKSIVVGRDDTVPITEVLEQATTLAPVVTTERYRLDRDAGHWDGFEKRCEATTVTCFRTTDLAERPSANVADFLVHAAGVTVGACGGGPSRATQCGKVAMRSSVIPPAYCEPSLFVDGFLWNPHFPPAVDMTPNTPPAAPFVPTNIKGVEVYPTGLPRPLRFEGDPMCGAVVIWTK